jgi:hypothetical protein
MFYNINMMLLFNNITDIDAFRINSNIFRYIKTKS